MVGIIDHIAGLSRYVAEVMRSWGFRSCDFCQPDAIPDYHPWRHPVVIVPARTALDVASTERFVRAGGTLIVFEPDTDLARLAGLQRGAALEMPRRLRLATFDGSGFAGEAPPIVGSAVDYRTSDEVRILAYLFVPEQCASETPAITVSSCGQGRIIAFAFDLPRCILLLRQGDPARAGRRPTELAVNTGIHDAGWAPHADLMGRLLVDLVMAYSGMPLPLLDTMPAGAPGLLLYSGDEDSADPAAVREELQFLTQHGARMDLNVIPGNTRSTPADIASYRQGHDVNPHPDLRSVDGRPAAERAAELERQIRQFETTYGIKVTGLRGHCTAWCGYMEHVESLERCGVRMDSNYVSGCFMLRRDLAPYNPFGGALPMRFCRADGRLLEVYQQHTHLMDDVHFAPDTKRFHSADYSYRLAPDVFDGILRRIYHDCVTRFHTPLAVCMHPSNWVAFSRPHGELLVTRAEEQGIPVWSFTQWCEFWRRRDGWRFEDVQWHDGILSFRLLGGEHDAALRLALPETFDGGRAEAVTAGGRRLPVQRVQRHHRPQLLVSVPDAADITIEAVYRRAL